MAIKASLSLDQANTILTKLGSITEEAVPNSKLSFCDTDIAWMSSSSAVRSLWTGLYTVGLSWGWNCDLASLPKLTGRVTEVFGDEVVKIESLDKAAESAALVMSAIVGLGFLKTYHYEQYPPKVLLVEEAMTLLTQLTERIQLKVEELTPVQAVELPEEPRVPTLHELYDSLRAKYVDLQKRVKLASSQKVNFKGTEEFSNHIKQSNAALMNGVPEEVLGDLEFNALRAKYIQLIKLYQRLEIEARGYNLEV